MVSFLGIAILDYLLTEFLIEIAGNVQTLVKDRDNTFGLVVVVGRWVILECYPCYG
jgi:hypothetical protein